MTNLEKLIFVNKNWLTDPRVACKSASNLVKFIKKDLELEDELEQFWRFIFCYFYTVLIIFIIKKCFY
jgi:hypothetical protein